MELPRGHRAKSLNKVEHLQNQTIGLNSDTLLVIKLPDSPVLRVLSRSLFLAMVILTLPCIGSIFRGSSGSYFDASSAYQSSIELIDCKFLDLLLQDLTNEGVIKTGDKALIVGSGIGAVIDSSQFLKDNKIHMVVGSHWEQQSSSQDAEFDFVFVSGSVDTKLVDGLVKVGGILAVQLSNDVSNAFQKHSNYRIVYLRQYDSTVVAMRKTGFANLSMDSSTKRRLWQLPLGAKKAALNGLEGVLLEPPRTALRKSYEYGKKFRYLPDLVGDSLEGYRRRIFVDVGLAEENNAIMGWFNHNYPTRNQEFETYNIETMSETVSGEVGLPVVVSISDWLMKNVREEEFVVMKAEAEVVEELINRGTISLVDELFLECNNQWQNVGKNKSKRAYWECLALYGRLRDEGVAVHQWWG